MGKSRLRNGGQCDPFPRASYYRAATLRNACQAREHGDEPYGFQYSERHLQCVWFDAAHRPPVLHTLAGEAVEVVSPGRWNMEAGPDFLDAVLLIGTERRRIAGDIEIHVSPCDWQHHEHRRDVRYSRVVAHVSFFRGASQSLHLPAGAVEISLEDDLRANRGFSFESLDTSAYPYSEKRTPTPCGKALADRNPDCAVLLLETAGERRLELKAERIRRLVDLYGEENVLYEEVMCALGYKHNRAAFRTLASRVPFDGLRRECAGDAEKAFGLLAGVAGLLPSRVPAGWDRTTREYVRSVWDHWWKVQPAWAHLVMKAGEWSLAGVRPQNHPLRRIVAASALFGGPRPFQDLFKRLDCVEPGRLTGMMLNVLTELPAGSYWERRLGFSGPGSGRKIALVGAERAAAIACNVVVPFMAATGRLKNGSGGILDHLPAAHHDGVVRRTASALFGRDHNPALYRTGLRQQGLLQICHDFCENDRSACKDCALPSLIAGMD